MLKQVQHDGRIEGPKMTKKYDALIIGGGHNGLVCAFYLAKRRIEGPRARAPRYRRRRGGYRGIPSRLPQLDRELHRQPAPPQGHQGHALHERGWRIIERTISNFFPHEGGYLKLGGGAARTQAEFARFSQKDAETFPKYEAALERVAEVLRDMALKTRPMQAAASARCSPPRRRASGSPGWTSKRSAT
jgi:glycine/D-amino acid oxidase-like deaminating enzyme